MAKCEMCGSENRLFSAKVEGTILKVCKVCSKFGEIQKEKKHITRKTAPDYSRIEEATVQLVSDYSEIIKRKREELNLKQEEFAQKISEKASIIHKIETGHFEPRIDLAKKIEKFLKVSILERITEDANLPNSNNTSSFTLGDFIKIKKKV